MPVDPRDSGRWRRLRAQVRAGVTHCNECNRLLDHTRPRTSAYPSVDHVIPIEHGGDPFALTNLRVICTGCNSRKSARIRNGTATTTSTYQAARPTRAHRQCPIHGDTCGLGWHSRDW